MARSPWISDLHWVRSGRQSRSQKTQESLLDSAEELFAEKGSEATSVADVAIRAGCSVGALYHHFRDKRALLYALLDRSTEQYRATIVAGVDPARWKGASIADILAGYLVFSLEVGRDRPGFQRAGLEAALRDTELREQLAEVKSELERGLSALILARREQIGHSDPELATAFAIDQLGSMLKARLEGVLMPRQLEARPDPVFVREALRSVCGYLEIEPPKDLEEMS